MKPNAHEIATQTLRAFVDNASKFSTTKGLSVERNENGFRAFMEYDDGSKLVLILNETNNRPA